MLPIPLATVKAVGSRKSPNLSLLLRYFGPYDETDGEPQREQKSNKEVIEKILARWDRSACGLAAEAVLARRESDIVARRSADSKLAARRITAVTRWRAVSGTGQQSVYETGITLHSLYGFPHFPGSAAKGMTRAWAGPWMGEDVALMRLIFGNSWDEKGDFQQAAVEFLGGVPTPPISMELDIVNPHYPDWYESGKPPSDWSNPRPSYFLAIPPGVTFVFDIVGCKCVIDKALDLHVQALKTIGIGAKTAAGYGYVTGDRCDEL